MSAIQLASLKGMMNFTICKNDYLYIEINGSCKFYDYFRVNESHLPEFKLSKER